MPLRVTTCSVTAPNVLADSSGAPAPLDASVGEGAAGTRLLVFSIEK